MGKRASPLGFHETQMKQHLDRARQGWGGTAADAGPKDREHEVGVAELGSSASPGQPRWEQWVTWGPRSAQHALRPRKARPEHAHDGAATGRQKQGAFGGRDSAGTQRHFYFLLLVKEKHGPTRDMVGKHKPGQWAKASEKAQDRTRARVGLVPGADMTAWAIGRLRAPPCPTLPWPESPRTPLASIRSLHLNARHVCRHGCPSSLGP
ncbi:unnamed protein product [Rangifer tarandus platyrhynchus]|uniref:Uncharacterized protein n=2 Tax=Rangifer tarandus platyrhynchus TaxID=3082113 RepID=A0ABN8ZF06_RANTA|nr:unnamed protein product [Rangifer tarandus platyrhynchus]CAI9707542.1 unnamed protein product [Rangifer tarandus platyrhynchus]